MLILFHSSQMPTNGRSLKKSSRKHRIQQFPSRIDCLYKTQRKRKDLKILVPNSIFEMYERLLKDHFNCKLTVLTISSDAINLLFLRSSDGGNCSFDSFT